jgi:hypothetical protein
VLRGVYCRQKQQKPNLELLVLDFVAGKGAAGTTRDGVDAFVRKTLFYHQKPAELEARLAAALAYLTDAPQLIEVPALLLLLIVSHLTRYCILSSRCQTVVCARHFWVWRHLQAA